MTPEERGERAATLKRTGQANCCQSVLLDEGAKTLEAEGTKTVRTPACNMG
ncbi:MAG: hypothetical protein IKO55_10530 [Kiritimatiellae bacterium]|nr:hypothetical protein [Kiritimatiellia bacterium]